MTITTAYSVALDLGPVTPAWRSLDLEMGNGQFVAAANAAGGGIAYTVRDLAGTVVGSGTLGTGNEASPVAAGLKGPGGGFVIVDERTNSATDHDVEIHVRTPTGGVVADIAIATPGDDDYRPQVAALADGGFAVAWVHVAPGQDGSELWTAVYNADGTVRAAPAVLPPPGGFDFLSSAPFLSMTPLSSGGFAITLENDEESGTWILDADNTVVRQPAGVAGIDSSTTILPNGFLLETYAVVASNLFSDFIVQPYAPFDTSDSWYIRAKVLDPATGAEIVDTLIRGQQMPDGIGFAAYYPTAWRDVNGGVSLSYKVADERWGYPYDPFTIYLDQSTETRHFDLVRTTTGDGANNVLVGDALIDRLYGLGGADTLTGDAGNDLLDGGTGADSMTGGLGDDTYVVDDAGDTVVEVPGQGTDTVQASITWTLGAGLENLTLTGNADIDGTGNALANVLTGNTGANVLTGLGGDDTYIVDKLGDVVVEAPGEGTDSVQSSVSFVLGPNLENLTLTGSSAIDGTGNAQANTIAGNSADNVLAGLGGGDALDGGGGNDTADYSASAARVIVDLSTGAASGGDAAGDTLVHIENLTGSAFNDVLTGDAGNNVLRGGLGIDTLTGGNGNDTLEGGGGVDRMTGGLGNDIYYVDVASDKVTELAGQGFDTIFTAANFTLAAGSAIEELRATVSTGLRLTGNELDNTIYGGSGNDIINGGAGGEDMFGGAGDDTYYVDEIFHSIPGGWAGDRPIENPGEGTDTVITSVDFSLVNRPIENLRAAAGAGGLTLSGNEVANVIYGGDGNDTINGNGGADYMRGWLGDDTYTVDDAGDVVKEYADQGTDLVRASFDYVLGGNVENLTLTGTGNLDGTGNGLANTLVGNTGNNVLDGKAGADAMKGGAGDDTYIVDNAGDVVTEGANQGADQVMSKVSCTLASNVENLTLTGTGAIDGTGNSLANALAGNAAANRLDGKAGNDLLTGGAGSDTFVFSTALNSATNVDTIADFAPGSDRIALNHSIFAALPVGDLSADAFVQAMAATTTQQHILYDQGSGTISYDKDGSGAAAAVAFAHVAPGQTLSYHDFQVI